MGRSYPQASKVKEASDGYGLFSSKWLGRVKRELVSLPCAKSAEIISRKRGQVLLSLLVDCIAGGPTELS